MKKAKIILSAITVSVVVSGALAFKAKSMQGNLHCTTVQGRNCTRFAEEGGLVVFTTTNAVGAGVDGYCTAKSAGDACSSVTITVKVTVDS